MTPEAAAAAVGNIVRVGEKANTTATLYVGDKQNIKRETTHRVYPLVWSVGLAQKHVYKNLSTRRRCSGTSLIVRGLDISRGAIRYTLNSLY